MVEQDVTRYWCTGCQQLHDVHTYAPTTLYATGFRYIRSIDAKVNIGECTKETTSRLQPSI